MERRNRLLLLELRRHGWCMSAFLFFRFGFFVVKFVAASRKRQAVVDSLFGEGSLLSRMNDPSFLACIKCGYLFFYVV